MGRKSSLTFGSHHKVNFNDNVAIIFNCLSSSKMGLERRDCNAYLYCFLVVRVYCGSVKAKIVLPISHPNHCQRVA